MDTTRAAGGGIAPAVAARQPPLTLESVAPTYKPMNGRLTTKQLLAAREESSAASMPERKMSV
jgi:hypothetical protein